MKSETTSLHYSHIAARIFGAPLLIEQSKLVTILEVLGPRLGIDAPQFTGESPKYSGPTAHLAAMQGAKFLQKDAGHFVGNGVAVIPIVGSLVQRSDAMSAMSGMLGYSRIAGMFTEAMQDPSVREVLLEIDSPGGEVAGVFDLADRMHAARGAKKVTAVVNEVAASAAYLLASVADEIVVPRTGAVGSIGVVTAHFDQSKAMEKRGVAVTFIYAGDRKIDGNPYGPMPEAVRAELQSKIDSIYRMFVETVARNRGMSADAVRATQAGMFLGAAAIDAGLATRVGNIDSEITAAVVRHRPGGTTMTTKTTQPAAADGDDKIKAAVKADRARCKAIAELPEAKGREKLATALAEKGMSIEEAKELLAAAPKRTSLDERMEGHTPGIPGHEYEPDSVRTAAAGDDFKFRGQVFDGAAKPNVH